MSIDLSGIYPPTCLAFSSNGEIDKAALRSNTRRYLAMPLAGLVIHGSNGEAVHLTDSEKVDVVRTVRQEMDIAKSKQLLIVGASECSTIHTIKQIKALAAVGADVALIATPWYYAAAMSSKRVELHFTAIADASPIPILLYNVPKFTGYRFPVSLTVKLAKHKNIIGIKDSGGNISKIALVASKTAKEDFQVLAGSAGFLYPALAVGAVGAVCALANIAGEKLCHLVSLYKQGRREEALALQYQLIGVNTAVTATYGIPGLKYCLDLLPGFVGGSPRLPLTSLTDPNQQADMRAILHAADLLPKSRL